MSDKKRISTPLDLAQHVPAFTLAPALRCYYHEASSPRVLCGELAVRRRRGRSWIEDQYFCLAHAEATDEPITGDRVFRRVRFSVDILLAAASLSQDIAHSEALQRLEAAIASVGGILDVDAVRSTFGRYSPSLLPGRGVSGQELAEEDTAVAHRCLGSGDVPSQVEWLGPQAIGRCPYCRRWIALEAPSMTLEQHRFRPAPVVSERPDSEPA